MESPGIGTGLLFPDRRGGVEFHITGRPRQGTSSARSRWKAGRVEGREWRALENRIPVLGVLSLDDGKLYHMNAHGNLACLDAATGGVAWLM